MNRLAACVVACLVTVPGARVAAERVPAEPSDVITRLLAEIHARLDATVIARPPKLVPPQPVKLGWKLTKLGSLDLGGPLATLVAGDLDGDGKAELYAVTPREVIAISADKKLRELGRVAFSGDPEPAPPRDVIATATIDGSALLAAASGWQHGLRVTWQGGALVGAPLAAGYPVCAGETLQRTAGRNYFGDLYGARCTAALVDSDGYPLKARAALAVTNKLDIAVERCATRGLGCQLASRYEVQGVGTAFEIADLDRDGAPELLFAGAGAPGDPDALKIVALGADDKTPPKLRKAFAVGGVAGIAVGDLDGNGTPDGVAAVRIAGAPKVDLWRVE